MEYGLKNASTYEQMIFLKTVTDSLSVNNNSRYIVEVYGRICSVPEQFDKNKLVYVGTHTKDNPYNELSWQKYHISDCIEVINKENMSVEKRFDSKKYEKDFNAFIEKIKGQNNITKHCNRCLLFLKNVLQ